MGWPCRSWRTCVVQPCRQAELPGRNAVSPSELSGESPRALSPSAPQRTWRLTVDPQERPAHTLLVPEPDIASDHFDRLGSFLYARKGHFHAQPLDCSGGSVASLLQDQTSELPRTDPCGLGYSFERKWLVLMISSEFQYFPSSIGMLISINNARKLALNAPRSTVAV